MHQQQNLVFTFFLFILLIACDHTICNGSKIAGEQGVKDHTNTQTCKSEMESRRWKCAEPYVAQF